MLNVTALFIPMFLLIVVFEMIYSYKKKDKKYTLANTTMNLAIGTIDQIGALLYFLALYVVMDYVYVHFRFYQTDNLLFQWVGGYLAVDFLSYWYHRLSHRVNILWAGHITHHSSVFYNYSNGFRTSLFQGVNRILFWALLPLFGFQPLILVLILQVSGIYDFILHTEYIPKLGFLEKIFITPSMHRVHHGRNALYIDKNYGSTFVIWDKMFGTFQEETEKVEYGVTGNYTDTSPLRAIGCHYRYLWNAVSQTSDWKNKALYFFMPPDWKVIPVDNNRDGKRNRTEKCSPELTQYAWYLLGCSIAGILLLLIYIHFLKWYEVGVFAAIAITMVSSMSIIFNDTFPNNFEKLEKQRVFLALILLLFVIIFHESIYGYAVILFLCVTYGMISRVVT
jgi:sterol desaturase/sphingolipid hydroxylase (fatty acid hydroxylase superfamily)